ncbi:hypothetical protein KIL84_004909 [Mauremys mutica]|uniref:protein-ribulosamine 3-kinase n=1 Tax=Mauremys mutica TaxID=74926 RepID=A0A9D4B0F2_9SAUR|nr:hypothetical protein KIL84_004909 [Mauremys mutica]
MPSDSKGSVSRLLAPGLLQLLCSVRAPPALARARRQGSSMEAALKRELGTSVLRPTGHSGGGCISQGQSYDTDGGRVYVKSNSKAEARRMFEGEMESLSAILQTQTVKVPKPIKVIDVPGGSTLFVMEHLEMRSLNRSGTGGEAALCIQCPLVSHHTCIPGINYKLKRSSRHSAKLGTQLADLHLHNQKLGEKLKKEGNTVGKSEGQTDIQFVDRFGFHTVTCCGYLPQVNDWQNDWVTFYARQRIQPQMDMVEKNSGDREARELWAQLQLKIPSLFCDMEIVPTLLHGDLWGGNVAEDDSGPIIFDPASFYGHSEYELAIAGMFGGFSNSFYSAYHSKIPKAPGFEKRLKLYQLFHYMNHWNHFGSGYRGSSLNIMRNLVK